MGTASVVKKCGLTAGLAGSRQALVICRWFGSALAGGRTLVGARAPAEVRDAAGSANVSIPQGYLPLAGVGGGTPGAPANVCSETLLANQPSISRPKCKPSIDCSRSCRCANA